jgi:membrane protein DedA with SNARE-associated domain
MQDAYFCIQSAELRLLQHLVDQIFSLVILYGYWIVGIVIALESLGLPLPGEATLIAACVYAGSTQRLAIVPLLLVAIVGAVLGDNIGYWIGREAGFKVLARYGGRVGLTGARLRLGQFLFLRHGGKIVFFGRFVAVLRILAALLAGANRMPWWRFVAFNLAGAMIWVGGYGSAAYVMGGQMEHFVGPIGLVALVLAVLVIGFGYFRFRRHEMELQEAADAYFGRAPASEAASR